VIVACTVSWPSADIEYDNQPDVMADEITDEGLDIQMDVRPEIEIDVPPDVPPDVCTPKCELNECGSNGCNGRCTCGFGQVCNDELKMCDDCKKPSTWGPIGMVDSAKFPDVNEIQQFKCADFSGDGKFESSFSIFATTLNELLNNEIEKGFYGAVAEFQRGINWQNSAEFSFYAMAAGAGAPGGDVYVNPLFYNPSDCLPYLRTTSTKIEGGQLSVGPVDLSMHYPWNGINLAVQVMKVSVSGNVTSSDAGIALTDGLATGYITKDVVDAIVEIVNSRCPPGATEPAFCKNANLLDLLPEAFEQHGVDIDKDETNDALAICVKFTLAPAIPKGYGEEPTSP
jgi:hypothetical protein